MFPIVLYHGVDSGEEWQRQLDSTDREYILDRQRFERHIQHLARRRIAVRLLDECMNQDADDQFRVALTFDDGDLSCQTTVAPILERFGFRGEFFVVSRWVGRPGFMTKEHLRDLVRRGHRVNSHSQTHPKLNTLDSPAIENEVAGSKIEIEAMVDTQVRYFSVPGGAYDQRVLDAVRRAGYVGALISAEGYNDGSSVPFVLRRFAARSYTRVGTLAAICEWRRYTSLRVALKRCALSAARRVVGGRGYDRFRGTVVSRKMRKTARGS